MYRSLSGLGIIREDLNQIIFCLKKALDYFIEARDRHGIFDVIEISKKSTVLFDAPHIAEEIINVADHYVETIKPETMRK